MSLGTRSGRKTEHTGAKNSSAKNGYYGPRTEAKRDSRKGRRYQDKKETK